MRWLGLRRRVSCGAQCDIEESLHARDERRARRGVLFSLERDPVNAPSFPASVERGFGGRARKTGGQPAKRAEQRARNRSPPLGQAPFDDVPSVRRVSPLVRGDLFEDAADRGNVGSLG